MTDRIRITPSDRDVNRWTRVFVPPTMLWWWDDSPIPYVDQAVRVVDRADLRNEPLFNNILYVNAFHTWAMPKEVTRVIVDDGSWSAALSNSERRKVSELQVGFKRGLCVPRERFLDAPLPESAIADGRVVLDTAMWTSLPDHAKNAVIQAELPEWDSDASYEIPVETPGHIISVANTFVEQEGINCLSVTAFAITGNQEDLSQWMFPKAFLDVLRNYGYTEVIDSSPRQDDVIVFRNEVGSVVHAAYVLASDRVLNKNGQTSFNPIAITDLSTLRSDWSRFESAVFRR